VTTAKLNVRDNPSIQSNVLDTVKNGEKVCVYGFNGNWAQVASGWVSSKYLHIIESVVNEEEVSQVTNIASASVNAPITYSNAQPREPMTMAERVAWTIFIIIALVYFVFLMLGVAGKVVFYYDGADLFISLLPWILMFVTMMLIGVYQPDETSTDIATLTSVQKIIGTIGSIFILLFSVQTIYLSVKYNRSAMMGIPIGIFKLVSVVIGVFVLIGQIATMKDKKTRRNEFYFAMFVFGGVVWLAKKLINGKRVYKNKGW